MTRRERRERERAAEAAGSDRPAGPTADSPAAGPPGAGSQNTAPTAGPPGSQQSRAPWSQPAGSQQPAPAGEQRPLIRPASRAPGRTGSGPAHHHASPQSPPAQGQPTQAYPAQAHPAQAYPAPGSPTQGTPAQGSPTSTFQSAGPTGGWSTSQGQGAVRGPGAAQSAGATSAADPSGRGDARGAAAASAVGAGRTDRRRKTEYQPLGPVRGTIRAFGELCITAGMVLILFVVWQLWWTDIAANRDNEVLADQLITDWQENPDNTLPDDPDTPFVADPVAENTGFGIMYVPRFGEDYYRTVAEGVSMEPVLNRMGVGRYPSSAMPGEVGNFSVAGHRVTYGKPLNQIHQLRPGDEIVVQTGDGFYTYTFRNFEIVLPDATEVLAAVPTMPDYKGKDRIMTLTACNPMFSAQERYVAYAELTDWKPAGDGAPASIADSPAFQKVGGDA
ncbi:class E sortase [Brevibacterium sp. Mu109]|uniref:class E sortase n=1 Tax=Brevibacterium sp. Mu109 TaxID=1255669 RepID=UPI000C7587B6|nr:class E sortase [Brevibacterium sp. Mu109]